MKHPTEFLTIDGRASENEKVLVEAINELHAAHNACMKAAEERLRLLETKAVTQGTRIKKLESRILLLQGEV